MIQPQVNTSIHQHRYAKPHLAFSTLKLLGQGGEGAVYLVEDETTGNRYVHKTFKAPLGVTSVEALATLSRNFQPNEYGLAQLSLIWEDDTLVGLYYPFEELHTVHYRTLKQVAPVAQTMFTAYCRLQSYLLSQYQLVITDPVADHFMLNRAGRFHYIDYGISVKPADHPKVQKLGMLEYGLAMLLVNIYNNNLKREVRPVSDYRTDRAHAYFHSQRLQTLASQQPWVAALLTRLQATAPQDFYDPNFYLDLVDSYPARVRFPWAVIGFSKLLNLLKGFR